MIYKLNLFLVFVFSTLTFGQDKITHLDSLYVETNSDNYFIKKVIYDYEKDKNEYKVIEFDNKENKILEGTYFDKQTTRKIGTFTEYYSNGNKKVVSNYVEFYLEGKYEEWHENGSKRLEGEYIIEGKRNDPELKINNYWDENNIQKVKNGEGIYEQKNKYAETKGPIKNGFKEGKWEGIYYNSHSYVENYKNGKFISGINTDLKTNETFEYVDLFEKPNPIDGIEHFYKYVGNNFKHTKEAKRNGIGGRIVLNFVIEKDG